MNALKNILLILAIVFSSSAFAQKKEIKEVKFISKVDCMTCKSKIEKHMAYCKGVKSVIADVETKGVTIGYNASKTDETKLKAELEKTGYGAELIKKSCCSSKEETKCKGDPKKKPCCSKKTE